MRLFILAAGKGTRLWPLTKDTPKSLLQFEDGTTMLDRQIQAAIESDFIDEVVVITGYKSGMIEEKLKQYGDKIKTGFIFNPVYDITNNLVSLWTGHLKMLEGDFLITNGDNIYAKGVFDSVLNSVKDKDEVIAITIDYKDDYDDDDMKVSLSDKKLAKRVSKEIPPEKTDAESVGLAIVKGEKSRQTFVNAMISLLKNKEYLNRFWLEVFNYLADRDYPVLTVEIERDKWQELDFHPDMDLIKEFILKKRIVK